MALFLDYDGTLTPIVEHPEQALLSQQMRSMVEALTTFLPVAIVSGRELTEVRKHVGIVAAYYAGSHGFDLAGPDGWHKEHDLGREYLVALEDAARTIRERLHADGAWVESKTYAITVHYRQAAEKDIPAVEALVDAVAATEPRLRRTGGKKVFELRPDIDWHKGKAVAWLLDALGLADAGVIPIYIGDDVTDEDAFHALRDRGVGIVVREEAAESAAQFSLRNPNEVEEFLALLARTLQ